MLPIETPFQSYMGLDGKPLTNGKIYIGQVGTDPTVPANQVPIFWDDALTIPAAQPVRTNAGYIVRNGTPAKIYVADVYSQTVQNASGVTVFYAPNSSGTIGGFISQFISSAGASLIGYIQAGVGAVRRTIQDRLRDTVSIKDFGAKGDGTTDDTSAINACFSYATDNGKTVHIPDGFYIVTNLIFGNQSTSTQSQAPLGLVGSSRGGAILIAKAGTTGTIFKAWSLAGVKLSDFAIYTNGTTAMAMDLEWKPGVGPSTQNEISRIRVLGGTAPVHVSLINLNDTYPSELSVIASAPTQCCIDARQSGGLLIMDRCIWDGGFMRVSAQNMDLRGCWGFGIELSASGVNNIGISGGYLYPNEARGQNIWSESFSSFNSTHSLTIGPGTQIITSANNGFNGVFDLNAYSSIEIIGVEFVSLGGLARMWGPNCRRDSFTNVSVNFVGGSFDNRIEINEPGAFDIQYRNFINKATGYAYKNSYKNYYATGGNAANFAAGNWYEFIPEGTMVEGVYVVWFKWDHKGAGNPFILNAVATITVPQITIGIAGNGADIPTVVGEFRTGLQSVVKFRLASSANPVSPRVEFNSSIPLPDPGVLTWTLTKIS